MNVISEDSIKNLVDTFYRKVRMDEQLGPIFERAIRRLGTPPRDDARLLVVGDAH